MDMKTTINSNLTQLLPSLSYYFSMSVVKRVSYTYMHTILLQWMCYSISGVPLLLSLSSLFLLSLSLLLSAVEMETFLLLSSRE